MHRIIFFLLFVCLSICLLVSFFIKSNSSPEGSSRYFRTFSFFLFCILLLGNQKSFTGMLFLFLPSYLCVSVTFLPLIFLLFYYRKWMMYLYFCFIKSTLFFSLSFFVCHSLCRRMLLLDCYFSSCSLSFLIRLFLFIYSNFLVRCKL